MNLVESCAYKQKKPSTTYVTMKKTSVALLCMISTKSKVGTEFIKPFEIEAHLPPAKKKKGRCQTVLGTYD
jgi:hypothetical protein